MDYKFIKFLAFCSNLSYEKTKRIKSFFEKSYSIKIYDKHDVEGFLLEDDEKQILVIRGTEILSFSLKDLFNNFNISSTSLYNIKVHSGYYNYAYKIYKEIYNDIKNNKKLYITGHSQGGAVASILSIIFNSDAYVFGCPKIVSNNIDNKITRFTLNTDLIDSFPYIKFKHLGKEIKLYDKIPLLSYINLYKHHDSYNYYKILKGIYNEN